MKNFYSHPVIGSPAWLNDLNSLKHRKSNRMTVTALLPAAQAAFFSEGGVAGAYA
jgi:hypothetical protein